MLDWARSGGAEGEGKGAGQARAAEKKGRREREGEGRREKRKEKRKKMGKRKEKEKEGREKGKRGEGGRDPGAALIAEPVGHAWRPGARERDARARGETGMGPREIWMSARFLGVSGI